MYSNNRDKCFRLQGMCIKLFSIHSFHLWGLSHKVSQPINVLRGQVAVKGGEFEGLPPINRYPGNIPWKGGQSCGISWMVCMIMRVVK